MKTGAPGVPSPNEERKGELPAGLKESSDFFQDEGPIDEASVEEFLETLEEIGGLGEEEQVAIQSKIEGKGRLFRRLFKKTPNLDEEEIRSILEAVYPARSRKSEFLKELGVQGFNRVIHQLLKGDEPVEERMDRFCSEFEEVEHRAVFTLAAELLHFYDPESHPLWSYWAWGPESKTGALPLMTTSEVDLEAETPGETYLRVEEAVDEIEERMEDIGFGHLEPPMGTDVAMASIHCVYTYLTLSMRMTQEFTELIPEPQGYAEKLLGVDKPPKLPKQEGCC